MKDLVGSSCRGAFKDCEALGTTLFWAPTKAQPLGEGVRTLQHFYWTAFFMGVGLALLHFNKVDYFKIYLSTIQQRVQGQEEGHERSGWK